MAMRSAALKSKPQNSRLKIGWIPIGVAILLLGAVGLSLELLSRSQAAHGVALVAYDEGVGFAPYLVQAQSDPSGADEVSDPAGNGSEPFAGADNPSETQPHQAVSLLGLVPDRLVIPAIDLDAPVVAVKQIPVQVARETYYQWLAPRGFRAGWHADSSLLGIGGNTVINGHHNAYGRVFQDLIEVEEGDALILSSGERDFHYVVTTKLIVEERFASIEERLANAAWIEPTDDERITLITCWPATSNTHRLIIVAKPSPATIVDRGALEQ